MFASWAHHHEIRLMTFIPLSTNLCLAQKVLNYQFPPTSSVSQPGSITYVPAWVLLSLVHNHLRSHHFPLIPSKSTFPVLMARIWWVKSSKLSGSLTSIVRWRTNVFALWCFTWRERPWRGFSGCTPTTSFTTNLYSYTRWRCDLHLLCMKIQRVHSLSFVKILVWRHTKPNLNL